MKRLTMVVAAMLLLLVGLLLFGTVQLVKLRTRADEGRAEATPPAEGRPAPGAAETTPEASAPASSAPMSAAGAPASSAQPAAAQPANAAASATFGEARPDSLFPSRALYAGGDGVWLETPAAGRVAILFTADDGGTWSELAFEAPPLGPATLTPHFATARVALLGAAGGTWRTEDGGRSWRRVLERQCSDAAFRGARAFALVAEGTATRGMVSDDLGLTWRACPAPTARPLALDGAVFLDDATLVAAFRAPDGAAGIARSEDGGCSFAPVLTAPQGVWLAAPRFADARFGWAFDAVAGAPAYATRDGGRTWARLPLPDTRVRALRLQNAERAALIDDRGRVFRSDNGGRTWRRYEAADAAALFAREPEWLDAWPEARAYAWELRRAARPPAPVPPSL